MFVRNYSQIMGMICLDAFFWRCWKIELWGAGTELATTGALHYNILQHTATHCNTLQHTATHCRLERFILRLLREFVVSCTDALKHHKPPMPISHPQLLQ